jgi:hypothetical protein
MTERDAPTTPTRDFRQEEERIDRTWLYITLAILAPFLFVLAMAAKGWFGVSSREAAAQGVPTLPEPAAEVSDVHAELFERPLAGELLKERQKQTLEQYGWVDRQRGVVRIPIDVAIELVAKDAKERP